MNTPALFIFRSNELYLLNDNTLPSVMPPEFASLETDRFTFPFAGESGVAVSVDAGGGLPFPVSQGGRWIAVRAIFGSDDQSVHRHSASSARALGLINWRRSTRFCPRCGGALTDHQKETALHCSGCGNLLFPRLSPAIIVLVHRDDTILLARHAARSTDVWACIAGYLEHGETLEECVKREVLEETGLTVTNVRYAGSQSWPFPDQFMIAFHADWESGSINVDTAELVEAAWFHSDALPAVPPPGTVAWRLIHDSMATT